MTRDTAYHLIRSLAQSEFDTRVKNVGGNDPPIWTPETWRVDAEGEGRTREAMEIGEAIRLLTPAEANKIYRTAWYQRMNGH